MFTYAGVCDAKKKSWGAKKAREGGLKVLEAFFRVSHSAGATRRERGEESREREDTHCRGKTSVILKSWWAGVTTTHRRDSGVQSFFFSIFLSSVFYILFALSVCRVYHSVYIARSSSVHSGEESETYFTLFSPLLMLLLVVAAATKQWKTTIIVLKGGGGGSEDLWPTSKLRLVHQWHRHETRVKSSLCHPLRCHGGLALQHENDAGGSHTHKFLVSLNYLIFLLFQEKNFFLKMLLFTQRLFRFIPLGEREKESYTIRGGGGRVDVCAACACARVQGWKSLHFSGVCCVLLFPRELRGNFNFSHIIFSIIPYIFTLHFYHFFLFLIQRERAKLWKE